MSDQSPVPVFMPPLASVLAGAERQKGSPLTSSEVEAIRDSSTCIMMESTHASRMNHSRGFVDVNPESVWADWHRLRPELVGGYQPRIILCVPGDDDLRRQCEPILTEQKIEHEFRPRDGKMVDAFRASSMTRPAFTPEDFARIDAHTGVLYILSERIVSGGAREVGSSFLQLGRRLLDAGGIAIKSESSGISHSRRRWTRFADAVAADVNGAWPNLFDAYVAYPIASETDLYSCGMHLLGAPDLIIAEPTITAVTPSGGNSATAAGELFRTFALYLLIECPTGMFGSGHTFSTGKDAPRYRVTWELCADEPEDSYYFNPFGRWRFEPAKNAG